MKPPSLESTRMQSSHPIITSDLRNVLMLSTRLLFGLSFASYRFE